MKKQFGMGALLVAGALALSTTVMAQTSNSASPSGSPSAGGSPSSGGYPGGGSPSGYPGGGSQVAGTGEGGVDTSTQSSTSFESSTYGPGDESVGANSETLPNTGGAPLIASMLGMLVAGSGLLLRRKIS